MHCHPKNLYFLRRNNFRTKIYEEDLRDNITSPLMNQWHLNLQQLILPEVFSSTALGEQLFVENEFKILPLIFSWNRKKTRNYYYLFFFGNVRQFQNQFNWNLLINIYKIIIKHFKHKYFRLFDSTTTVLVLLFYLKQTFLNKTQGDSTTLFKVKFEWIWRKDVI